MVNWIASYKGVWANLLKDFIILFSDLSIKFRLALLTCYEECLIKLRLIVENFKYINDSFAEFIKK